MTKNDHLIKAISMIKIIKINKNDQWSKNDQHDLNDDIIKINIIKVIKTILNRSKVSKLGLRNKKNVISKVDQRFDPEK